MAARGAGDFDGCVGGAGKLGGTACGAYFIAG